VGYVVEKFMAAEKAAGGSRRRKLNADLTSGTVPQRIQSCLQVLDIALNQKNSVYSSIVLADRTRGRSKKGGVLLTFQNAFGLTDLEKINPKTKLVDLGMDR
jgi:fatty acid synthase, animal type